MIKTRKVEFLQKLTNLLAEYNAEIALTVDENLQIGNIGIFAQDDFVCDLGCFIDAEFLTKYVAQ
jgi:hypothetical protein